MLEFESKRKFQKRLYSRITLVLLIIVLVFLGKSTYKIYKKHYLLKEDLENSLEIYEEYQTRKEQLESDLGRVDSEVGREEILRENYSLAKDGEEAIFIINPEEQEIEIVEEKSVWQNMKGLLIDLFN